VNNLSDGTIKINTKLDNSGIKKDIQEVNKVVESAGKTITESMNKAESSVKKVGTAFKSIDGSKIASQMKSVESAIDKTSTKIDAQKKKLTELKTSYDKATDTKSKNSIEQDMQKAEASIAKLETRLTSLNNKKIKLDIDRDALNGLDGEFKSASVSAVKELDKIEKKAEETGSVIRKNMGSLSIGEGIVKVGDKISNVGTKLTMGLTVPLVAVGVAATKVGLDFDSQMSRVKAISGATGEEFNKLKGQAIQLGADTAFSAKEAANGMENLASAGFNTTEIMSAMPGMLDLAASSGESVATSSDIAASALRGFGLEASDASHVADVLATNAAKTNAQVADTGEALKYVATNAHAAGWSLEETTAAIGELSNYGVKGSQAGTTLREMLVRLASPSKEAAGDMKTLGFNAFDSQGKMKSLSTIVGEYSKALEGKTDQQKQDYTATIFGQEAMSGLLALVQGGSGALDDLTNSYKNSDGAAKDMAKTMQDNAKSAIEQMTGSIETAAIKVEEDFAPIITELANYIQDLANKFADLSPEQQEFYAKLLMGAAALGPVIKGIGTLTTGIGELVKVAGGIGSLFGATEAATATGGMTGLLGGITALTPAIIPVVAAFAGLGVTIAALNTSQDQMKEKLSTTTDGMSDWEKAINGMSGYTFKSKKELEDLGIEYKAFGDNISDSFKTKVEESTDTLHNFELFLKTMNLDGIITDSESSDFNNQINKMVNDAIISIKGKQSESQDALSKLFKLDDNKIDETEQKVLDSISKGFDTQITEENKLKGEILAIKQKAVDEKRVLNNQEVKDVQDKLNKIKEIELAAVGGTQEEKAYAKNDFSARVSKVNPEDASKLLQDKKKAIDEENIKIKASYDTQIDMLKLNLANADEANKGAIQTEIDKFTKLRDDKTKLKTDEWNEYLKILQEKNPEALALINEYSGQELTKADADSQKKLKTMNDTFTGLNSITESGTYELYNTNSKAMEDVTVTYDAATGRITGAYSETSNQVGGYTDQMAKDNEKLGQTHAELAATCQTALEGLGGATIDASGKITGANKQTVGSLENLQTAEDGTMTGIYNLNGTPIEIKTNADGTISNLQDVINKILQIPSTKTIYIKTQQDTFDENRTHLNADGSVSDKYTGTTTLRTGLSHVNEHGWETANNNNVKMLDNGLAYLIGNHYNGGDGINDHMTSVNEMNNEISKQIGENIIPIVKTLTDVLGRVANNTGEIKNYTKETASNIIDSMNSTSGTFSGVQSQLDNATYTKDKANLLSIDDNQAYIDAKAEVDRISDMTTDAKKALGDEEYKISKDNADKSLDLAKKTAELDITIAKQDADEQVKIANDKKDRLTKIAEATTTAIKAQLEEEKAAAEKVSNDKLALLEKEYNSQVDSIDKLTKNKTDTIDAEIKALDAQTTDTSRADERKAANDNINVLKTKMANTKSQADKDALSLQIKDSQKALSAKEDAWNIEDQKAQLEAEKTLLTEKSDAKKVALKDEYDTQKANEEKKLKATDEYYSKLLETDSLNAQTRYTLLTSNNNDLVTLLNSYAPNWQNAGQSLADSLLTGLNSSKQSVQDAVSEMVSLRGTTSNATTTGYATGTSSNPSAGLYNVDELGWETSNGSVAYVSKGAAINNHMQSVADMKAEITRQVSAMKNSINAEQSAMKSLILGNIASNSSNSVTHNDNGLTLQIGEYHQHTNQNVEQMANELNVYRLRQKKY